MSARPVRRRRRALLATALAGALLACGAAARAQLPAREPLHWTLLDAAGRRQALILDATLFADPRTDWRARRLGATAAWIRGAEASLYLRIGWYVSDTGATPVLARWPQLAPAGVTPEDWPGGSTSVGWGNPEIGWLSALRLGVLGRWQLGLAAALPLGRDELYPYASTSTPLRAQLRRTVPLGPRVDVGALGGVVVSLDSSRDRLQSAAYPGGVSAALDLTWRQAARHALQAGVVAEWGGGTNAVQPWLAWRLPAGGHQELTVGVRRELGPASARAWATQAWLAWTIAPAPDPEPPVAK